ncbi:MAG: hypothetical protein EBU52_18595, partial [Cytophagia bacterium]|nr:hypothetical protein [Cytophagia bacterium]
MLIDLPFTFAQSQVRDSLKTVLDKSTNDRQKVDAMNALAYEYYDINDSLAFIYATDALQLSLDIEYASGIQYAYTLCGVGYFTSGQYVKALE